MKRSRSQTGCARAQAWPTRAEPPDPEHYQPFAATRSIAQSHLLHAVIRPKFQKAPQLPPQPSQRR